LAVWAQGLGRPRSSGPVSPRHLRDAVKALGVIQLDAINVLARTQFIVPFSRVGPYETARLQRMSGPRGELFEYFGHAASLLPVEEHPLFRWRMERGGWYEPGPKVAARINVWLDVHADYVTAVLAEVRDRGPLTAGQLADPRRRKGTWWERRSVGAQVLGFLFGRGELAGWRNPAFERIYDLPERVIDGDVLARPAPSAEDAQRSLLWLAARSLGVATVGDLAGYYMMKPSQAKIRVAELVDAGELAMVSVESWAEPGYCLPSIKPRPPTRTEATLISPFDSLIWDRERTRRLFGFDYRIEVYVREADRKYGYYVLPLLWADRLVARFDLKADRKSSTLLVGGAYLEPNVAARPAAAAAAIELRAVSDWLGLERVAVRPRGSLAPALATIVRRRRVPTPSRRARGEG